MMRSDAVTRFARWVEDEALPFWAERAFDGARGGFYESLDFTGAPVAGAARRVRVQSRQIHVFATAAALDSRAAGLARAGFDFMLARALPDNGARGCVHLLSADGAVIDDRRDLYDQAFLILACASLWRAFDDRRALDLAERTLAFLDRELASPAGGYLEDDRGTAPRRQNPHMHLFEALMALFDATGEARFLDRAARVFELFRTRFYDAERCVLREFFNEDLSLAPPPDGEIIEPGHMMEWVGLLERYGARVGIDLTDMQRALFRKAAELGACGGSPFLVDSVRLGAPAGGPRRLWPQTEYLKACVILAGKGEIGAAERGEALAEALFASYLDQPVAGLWCDRYDGAGLAAAKDVPASILYHLFDAALEIRRAEDAR